MVSSVRPQRGSRATSRTGARPWCTPTARMLRADRGGHLADQRRVEGRAPGQRRREDGGRPGGEAGQALLVRDRRDAEPARRDDPRLQAGRALRHGVRPGGSGRVPNTRVSWPRPSRIELGERRHRSSRNSPCIGATSLSVGRSPQPDAGQLRDLLVQGHPAEQVRDPLGGRPGRVAPGARVGPVAGVRGVADVIAPAGGVDSRTTSSVESSTRRLCSGRPSISSPSICAAARPISASGWRTVVSGGETHRATGRSSKPTTLRSCGIRSPRCRAAS